MEHCNEVQTLSPVGFWRLAAAPTQSHSPASILEKTGSALEQVVWCRPVGAIGNTQGRPEQTHNLYQGGSRLA